MKLMIVFVFRVNCKLMRTISGPKCVINCKSFNLITKSSERKKNRSLCILDLLLDFVLDFVLDSSLDLPNELHYSAKICRSIA